MFDIIAQHITGTYWVNVNLKLYYETLRLPPPPLNGRKINKADRLVCTKLNGYLYIYDTHDLASSQPAFQWRAKINTYRF